MAFSVTESENLDWHTQQQQQEPQVTSSSASFVDIIIITVIKITWKVSRI